MLQRGQDRSHAALAALGEVLDVLVQPGQADPARQVDGDDRTVVQDVAVGDQPQLHPGDIGPVVQPVRVGGQHVADIAQETAEARAGQVLVHTELFGMGEVGVLGAGLAQPRPYRVGVDSECFGVVHRLPPWAACPGAPGRAARHPGIAGETARGRPGFPETGG